MNRADKMCFARKVLDGGRATVALLLLAAVLGQCGCSQRLPPPQQAVEKFQRHRSDFVRFAALLRQDTAGVVPPSGGFVDVEKVPELRRLADVIGVKFVRVEVDGAIEFALWGFGTTI